MLFAGFPAEQSRETFWKTLQTFCVTRILIAIVLLAYLVLNTARGFWDVERVVLQQTCMLYVLAAILFAALSTYYRVHFRLQMIAQLAVDLIAISVLYIAAGGAKSGLMILYLFPLAGGAILAPLLVALLFVSIVTLILLVESGYQVLQAVSDASTLQAGLYGGAFFIAVLAINRLASQLIRQEVLAAQRGRDLEFQEAINRLIISDMDDGVLVVGEDGTVLERNPAAERMLGWKGVEKNRDIRLHESPVMAPISDAFGKWLKSSYAMTLKRDATAYVVIKTAEEPALLNSTAVTGARRDIAAHLRLRFAAIQARGQPEKRTVIFLQDVSDIENRAQQLKLASMGRLTASIAHEVRNPLSAISHAATLVGEEMLHPTSLRMIAIIQENVARLNRMIEDILGLSRKAQRHGDPFSLRRMLDDVVAEFCISHPWPENGIELTGPADELVIFDPLHLREVVVNLLSNAVRYASKHPGSIHLQIVSNAACGLELHVQDDGPTISEEIRAHLFEPFYTTSSKGTGLGLYLARELCLNNGAMLDYEYRLDRLGKPSHNASGRFVISFDVLDMP